MNDIYDELNRTGEEPIPQEVDNKPFDKAAWGEKKQAEKQMAYDTMNGMAENTASDGKQLQNYLDTQARLDRYSVGNVLLIMAQKPAATQLKDYDGWKESGTGVRPKEKGIVIIEPGNEYVKENGETAVSFNTKKVFDISQTFSKDKANPAMKRDERTVLKALVSNAPVPIKAVDELKVTTMGALYDDKQNIVLVRRGLDNADFFAAVSTELAHACLSKDCEYNRSEQGFKAYCVSYMLCKRYGFDTKNFDFKELPEIFRKNDASGVRNTLSEMRDAMTEINDRMSKSFEQNRATKQKDYER